MWVRIFPIAQKGLFLIKNKACIREIHLNFKTANKNLTKVKV